MDTPLGFRFRDTLHPVGARLELEPGIHPLTDNACDDFLVAAQFGFVRGNDFDLPALTFCIAHVHAEQAARKQRRLITTCPCTDFQKDIALIIGILG